MSASTVARPRAMDLGKVQRKYVVEPRELPVPLPAQEPPLPDSEPIETPEREFEKV